MGSAQATPTRNKCTRIFPTYISAVPQSSVIPLVVDEQEDEAEEEEDGADVPRVVDITAALEFRPSVDQLHRQGHHAECLYNM